MRKNITQRELAELTPFQRQLLAELRKIAEQLSRVDSTLSDFSGCRK